MRRLRFIPALLVTLLSGCSESLIEQRPADYNAGEKGMVSISLSTDLSNEAVGTRADADEPDVDDFRIAIYKVENQMRLYNDSYANSVGKEIPLNAGEYRLVAQHGDTLGCGFNKPYYLADPLFVIDGGVTTVEAVAKLANVKLDVEFDATISDNYSDYYAIVRHNSLTGKNVKFTKTETRYGYIPAGELILEVYADVDGEWKYFKTAPAVYNPNDFVTFNITTNDREGDLVINITVDTTTEEKNEVIEIPAITVPQDAPSITLAGFDNNIHEIVEGQDVAGHNAMASFLARGALAHCYLTVDSEWLSDRGVPAEMDLADIDDVSAAALRNAGISWDEDMATTRTFSYIDFTDMVAEMLSQVKAEATDVTMAKFTLRIVDSVGKEITEEFSVVSGGVTLGLTVEEYNVWARKVVDPVGVINKGMPSLVVFQASVDGGASWVDLDIDPAISGSSSSSSSGYTLNFGTIPAEPGTTYKIRTIYNKNENCVSPVLTIKTEDALQLGNSGFEDYQLVQTRFTPLASSSYTRNWYLPYASGETDPWWACNSMQSMPDGHTGWSVTWCKNFPSSGYVKDRHSGNKAAMIFCVNIGNTNTANSYPGTTYEGELWIGTSDADGNIATQGHSFASRPSKLSFYYKYGSNSGRTFFVDTWVKDADGNIIASAQVSDGPAADTWTRYEIPYNYSVINKKAASIYVRISSSYGNGNVSTAVDFDLGEESVTAHAGCFLKLDDFELIYE